MGLRETVQQAAKTAILAVGNIAEIVTYTSVAYTNGQATGATMVENLKAVRQEFDIAKVDGVNVLAQDRQYLIAALDLGLVPHENDTIEAADGSVWTVKRFAADPAGATYLIHVRT